jgi:hypothetical protein
LLRKWQFTLVILPPEKADRGDDDEKEKSLHVKVECKRTGKVGASPCECKGVTKR